MGLQETPPPALYLVIARRDDGEGIPLLKFESPKYSDAQERCKVLNDAGDENTYRIETWGRRGIDN